jgi:hypothetical protein
MGALSSLQEIFCFFKIFSGKVVDTYTIAKAVVFYKEEKTNDFPWKPSTQAGSPCPKT